MGKRKVLEHDRRLREDREKKDKRKINGRPTGDRRRSAAAESEGRAAKDVVDLAVDVAEVERHQTARDQQVVVLAVVVARARVVDVVLRVQVQQEAAARAAVDRIRTRRVRDGAETRLGPDAHRIVLSASADRWPIYLKFP